MENSKKDCMEILLQKVKEFFNKKFLSFFSTVFHPLLLSHPYPSMLGASLFLACGLVFHIAINTLPMPESIAKCCPEIARIFMWNSIVE